MTENQSIVASFLIVCIMLFGIATQVKGCQRADDDAAVRKHEASARAMVDCVRAGRTAAECSLAVPKP